MSLPTVSGSQSDSGFVSRAPQISPLRPENAQKLALRPPTTRLDFRPKESALRLTVIRDGARAESFELVADEITIGRKAVNTVTLPDKCVSGYHAKLRKLPTGDLEITDLESFNGTIINGKPIKTSIVRPGDHLLFGITEALLETHSTYEDAEELVQVFQVYQEECGLLEQRREALSREAELNRSRVEHLKTERVRVLKECDQVQQKLESDRSELYHVRKELIAANSLLDRMQQELNDAKAEREELNRFKTQRQEMDAQLTEKKAELKRTIRAIDEAKAEQKDLAQNCLELRKKESELAELTLEIEEAQDERDKLRQESQDFRLILDDFEGIKKTRARELDELDAQKTRKQAELEFYQRRIEQSRVERDGLLDESRDLRHSLASLEQRRDKLALDEIEMEDKLQQMATHLPQPETKPQPAPNQPLMGEAKGPVALKPELKVVPKSEAKAEVATSSTPSEEASSEDEESPLEALKNAIAAATQEKPHPKPIPYKHSGQDQTEGPVS